MNMKNLYKNPEHNTIRKELKSQLRDVIRKLDDPVEAPALMGKTKAR